MDKTTIDKVRETLAECFTVGNVLESDWTPEWQTRWEALQVSVPRALAALSLPQDEGRDWKEYFDRAVEALRLYGSQFEEVYQLAHKRPVPSSIGAMLCNMTERHSCEMAKAFTADEIARRMATRAALSKPSAPAPSIQQGEGRPNLSVYEEVYSLLADMKPRFEDVERVQYELFKRFSIRRLAESAPAPAPEGPKEERE